jgi:hypothetical protein
MISHLLLWRLPIKKFFMFLTVACMSFLALTPQAEDRLASAPTLATDDQAALAQIHGKPDRYVMIYFGDYRSHLSLFAPDNSPLG